MNMETDRGRHDPEDNIEHSKLDAANGPETDVVDFGRYDQQANSLERKAADGETSAFIIETGKGIHTPSAAELYVNQQESRKRAAAKEEANRSARSIPSSLEVTPAPRVDSNPTRAYNLNEMAAMKASIKKDKTKKPWWKIW